MDLCSWIESTPARATGWGAARNLGKLWRTQNRESPQNIPKSSYFRLVIYYKFPRYIGENNLHIYIYSFESWSADKPTSNQGPTLFCTQKHVGFYAFTGINGRCIALSACQSQTSVYCVPSIGTCTINRQRALGRVKAAAIKGGLFWKDKRQQLRHTCTETWFSPQISKVVLYCVLWTISANTILTLATKHLYDKTI